MTTNIRSTVSKILLTSLGLDLWWVRDCDTDGGIVADMAIPMSLADAAARVLRDAGYEASVARDQDTPYAWLYVASKEVTL